MKLKAFLLFSVLSVSLFGQLDDFTFTNNNGTTTIINDSTVEFTVKGCIDDGFTIKWNGGQRSINDRYDSGGNIDNCYVPCNSYISDYEMVKNWSRPRDRNGSFYLIQTNVGNVLYGIVKTIPDTVRTFTPAAENKLSGGKLIICEERGTDNFWFDFDGIVFDHLSYKTNMGIKTFVNGVETNLLFPYIPLVDGDSLTFLFTNSYTYTGEQCVVRVDSGANNFSNPIIIQSKANPKVAYPTFSRGGTKVCSPDSATLVMDSQLDTSKYKWIYGVSTAINEFSGLELTPPYWGTYYIKQMQLTSHTDCPAISEDVKIEITDTCGTTISGNVYELINSEGGTTSVNVAGLKVVTSNGGVTFSDEYGNFDIVVDYFLDQIDIYIDDNIYSSEVTRVFQGNSHIPIEVTKKEESDLRISYSVGAARPGFTITNYVTIQNIGKDSLCSAAQITFDAKCSNYQFTSGFSPDYTTGNSLYWTEVCLAPGEIKRTYFSTELSSSIAIGDSINLYAYLQNWDDNINNNEVNQYVSITGSYDPNDKNAEYIGVNLNDYIEKETEIIYTIRFQNTGNDTAFTVVVKDPITSKLDLSSVEMLDASHQYSIAIEDESLAWRFNSILLPDSTTDLAGSQGFIKFKIAQNSNNNYGDTITNKAFIYFDYNNPIITNEKQSILLEKVITSTEEIKKTITIWPNPTNDVVHWNINILFTVSDARGNIVKQGTGNSVNLHDLNSGIYFITLNGKQAKIVKR